MYPIIWRKGKPRSLFICSISVNPPLLSLIFGAHLLHLTSDKIEVPVQ